MPPSQEPQEATPLSTNQILQELGVEPTTPSTAHRNNISTTKKHTFKIEGLHYPAKELYIAALTTNEAVRAAMLQNETPVKLHPEYDKKRDAQSLADIANGKRSVEFACAITRNRAAELVEGYEKDLIGRKGIRRLTKMFGGKMVRIVSIDPSGEVTEDRTVLCEKVEDGVWADLQMGIYPSITPDSDRKKPTDNNVVHAYDFLPTEIGDGVVTCDYEYKLRPGHKRIFSVAS
jgi:hypothetical protein